MTRFDHASDAALADLGPADEVGTPDDELVKCSDCGVIHRPGDETHAEQCGGSA